MKDFCIIIPAVKKNVAFPDDLIKKLAGITLVQRAINTAKDITSCENIFLVTDSQEITLICERNSLNCIYKQDLRFQGFDIINELKFFILKIYRCFKSIIILWPYTPLLSKPAILDAYRKFLESDCDMMMALKEEKHRVYRKHDRNLQDMLFGDAKERLLIEMRSFLIFKSSLIADGSLRDCRIYPYVLDENEMEIKSYQDWWVCEKLLQKKRIVFRVIGYPEVGMGHIYRALSLAHEITDHEVIFICDGRSSMAVNKIAGYDYRVEIASLDEVEEKIVSLRPDLVINDMLNTADSYVLKLKEKNIRVVSFEDLGSGAEHTDLTINELYDEPQLNGTGNTKWGHRYFFVRDEFNDARPHKFKKKVDNLLVTFGGTDPNNLTFRVLNVVADFCRNEGIRICVVTGDGYRYKEELSSFVERKGQGTISFTYATGVMSKIMEKTQIAISSNGRTSYELAHMNIPSIIISHHERENTHLFTRENNGFINLDVFSPGKSEEHILAELKRLVRDIDYRKRLFDNTKKFNFSGNKSRVVKMILRLLD